MKSAPASSASMMCSTQLKLLVCLACFPARVCVCVFTCFLHMWLPWGNQGELLWPTSKSSPVFSRFLSSPALTWSRPANEPVGSYFRNLLSYFSSFLSLISTQQHPTTTLKVSSVLLSVENTPSQRVPS